MDENYHFKNTAVTDIIFIKYGCYSEDRWENIGCRSLRTHGFWGILRQIKDPRTGVNVGLGENFSNLGAILILRNAGVGGGGRRVALLSIVNF